MIPKTEASTVTSHLPGEVTSFSIQASGKAFRALIDGLYADKVLAPVRELMTNAHDAHVAAGNAHTPFNVIVPTNIDPTFGVRDFGTGMSHVDITGFYSTLFASSKEETNAEVGMLGLGSKSPFAYTESFTVRAFDGNEVRTYVAFLEQDVPKISMVDQSASNEPRGLEVKFPVKPHDVRLFVDAVKSVVLGFKVVPHFDTDAVITVPVPIASGAGWRLYKQADLGWSEGSRILQGCVTYPVPSKYTSDLPYGMQMLVEVPIGSVDVAISREALSFDPDTIRVVETAFHSAWSDFQNHVHAEYAKCTTELERLEFAANYDRSMRQAIKCLPVNLVVDLMPAHTKGKTAVQQLLVDKKSAGHYLMTADKALVTALSFESRDRFKFVFDDTDTIRRRSRILADAKYHNDFWIIPADVNQDLAKNRIKLLTGCKDEQFVKVSDLPDTGKVSKNAAPRDKLGVKRKLIADGAIWVRKTRSTVRMDEIRYVGRSMFPQALPQALVIDILKEQDSSYDAVVTLTEAEFTKINPPAAQSLGALIRAKVKTHVENAKLVYKWTEIESRLNRASIDYYGGRALMNRARPDFMPPILQGSGAKDFHKIKNFLDENELVDYTQVAEEAIAVVEDYKVRYPRLLAVEKFSADSYISEQDSLLATANK